MRYERHHLCEERTPVRVCKFVGIIFENFGVFIEIVKAVFIVISIQERKVLEKMGIFKPVKRSEHPVTSVITAFIYMKIVGCVSFFIQNIRQCIRHRIFYYALRIERRNRGITAHYRERLRTVGLIARMEIRHGNAVLRHGVERGRIFLIDGVPLAGFNYDQNYILTIDGTGIYIVAIDAFTHLPFGKIVIYVFDINLIYIGVPADRISYIDDKVSVGAKFTECLNCEKLFRIQFGVIIENAQPVISFIFFKT